MAQERKILLTVSLFFSAVAGSILLYQVPVYRLTMVIQTNNDMNSVQCVSNYLESLSICSNFLISTENGAVVLRTKVNKLDLALRCLGQMNKLVQVGAGTGPCINSCGQKSAYKRLPDGNIVEENSTPEVVGLNKTNLFRYFLFNLLLFAFIWTSTSFRKIAI